MTGDTLVRAWKEPDARTGGSLHPAGGIDLSEVIGGTSSIVDALTMYTVGWCGDLTAHRQTCGTFPTLYRLCDFTPAP
jgi:hypothetical protein